MKGNIKTTGVISGELDFKAIFTFIAVIETGSLYRASIALGCSQLSTSLHLKKARGYFSQQTFTRDGRKLVPTEYALELCEDLKVSVENLVDILNRNRA